MKWNRLNAVSLLIVSGLYVTTCDRCLAAERKMSDAQRHRRETTVITIQPNPTVSDQIIRLGDVATISGGDLAFQQQLRQLDLEDPLPADRTILIEAPQIEFRLRIAGINVDRVSIRGTQALVSGATVEPRRKTNRVTHIAATASQAEFIKPRPISDQDSNPSDEGQLGQAIIRSAKECVLRKLPWAAEDIEIRLAKPLTDDVRGVESASTYVCTASFRSKGPAIGRVHLQVIAESPSGSMFDVPLALDVRHLDHIVLAAKNIEQGHVIGLDDVYVDRRDVTELSDYCSATTAVIGKAAKHSIRALLPFRTQDLQLETRAQNVVLIKRKDQVKMSANVGSLTVYATGESQQEARLGELIRLKNIDSNTFVTGKVIGAGEVEIQF